MAFSGNISSTTFDTRKIIERAYGRCRIAAQQIVGEMVQDAKEELYLMLSQWASQQVPIWTIENVLLPLYEGVNELPVGTGTTNVMAASLRTLTEASGTNVDTDTSRTTTFSTATTVSTVGIKWSATPPATVTFGRSSDGATWTDVETHTVADASGEWTWVDMPSAVEALYFRVVGSGNITFDDIHYGNTPQETPMGLWDRQMWFETTNKLSTSSRPLNYFFDRKVPEPSLFVWPTPTNDAETSQVVVQRQRYIMDVGTLTQEIEVPQRWLDAVVFGLAARLALSTPEVPAQMIPVLDAKATEALNIAQTEEYDRGPLRLMPNISGYTA